LPTERACAGRNRARRNRKAPRFVIALLIFRQAAPSCFLWDNPTLDTGADLVSTWITKQFRAYRGPVTS